MQQGLRAVTAVAVEGIAFECEAEFGHVHADLMPPPGLQFDCE